MAADADLLLRCSLVGAAGALAVTAATAMHRATQHSDPLSSDSRGTGSLFRNVSQGLAAALSDWTATAEPVDSDQTAEDHQQQYLAKLIALYKDLNEQIPDANRAWFVVQPPQGLPVLGRHLQFHVCAQPEPSEDEEHVLVRVLRLTPRPRDRLRLDLGPFPKVVPCIGIGEVEKSFCDRFAEGDLVVGQMGWQDYALFGPEAALEVVPRDDHGLDLGVHLGLWGDPGLLAHVGLHHYLKPQAGETLLVTSAAGCVGLIVVQLAAKLDVFGHVVGVCGAEEKQSLLAECCHAVVCTEGKSVVEIREAVEAAAPNGVDCLFDTTGCSAAQAALHLLNPGARVAICGQTALVNGDQGLQSVESDTETEKGPDGASQQHPATFSLPSGMVSLLQWCHDDRLSFQSLSVQDFDQQQVDEARQDLIQLTVEGKVLPVYDSRKGLEHAAEAFLSLFHGTQAPRSRGGQLCIHVGQPSWSNNTEEQE